MVPIGAVECRAKTAFDPEGMGRDHLFHDSSARASVQQGEMDGHTTEIGKNPRLSRCLFGGASRPAQGNYAVRWTPRAAISMGIERPFAKAVRNLNNNVRPKLDREGLRARGLGL